MKNKEDIIEYLGLDYENKKEKWWKPTIKIAMEIEKEYSKEIENGKYGYGLTCYFENTVTRNFLEDPKEYNLIKIKDYDGYITLYEKVAK